MTTTFTADAGTDRLTAPAHRLRERARILLSTSGELPRPLLPRESGARFFARDVDGTSLALAYYPGGPAIDLLDAGTGTHELVSCPVVSALDAIYEGVVGYFRALEVSERYEVRFGLNELGKQINQGSGRGRAGRVVFIPGDDAGKFGKIGAPKYLGTRPRAIASFDELCRVHVWGRDGNADRTDERAHYRVTWDLFEHVLRALNTTAPGQYTAADPYRDVDPVEAVHGFAFAFLLTVPSRIVSEMPAVIRPNTAEPCSEVDPSVMVFPAGDVSDP